VHALHVIEKVVTTRESVTWYCAFAIAEVTEMRSGTMTMHTMGLALMAKQAGSRRKLDSDASLLIATERLQV
jgi:hypothetical protein